MEGEAMILSAVAEFLAAVRDMDLANEQITTAQARLDEARRSAEAALTMARKAEDKLRTVASGVRKCDERAR